MKVIEALQAVVPSPADPKGVTWSDPAWQQIAAHLGTRLPADFVEYHKVYGLGYFRSLTHPTSAYLSVFGDIHDASLSATIASTLTELRQTKERRPKAISAPLYWEPNGLMPWARAGGQTYLCWRVSGQLVDDWPVTVIRPASAQTEHFDVCMADFLAGLLGGRLQCGLVPKGLPGTRGVEFVRSKFDTYPRGVG